MKPTTDLVKLNSWLFYDHKPSDIYTCKDKKYVNVAGNAIELICFLYIYAWVGNERELQARTEKKDKRII